VIAPSALHKSDVGGIVLDVQGDAAVGEAFDRVTSVVDDAEGALVQEFVGSGHEVIVGMTEDPSFGPLIAFGLGGVFVELIGDVAFRIHPLTDVDVDEMIQEVKSARLLDGYRGGPAGDIPALKETLLRLSALVEAVPEIAEFDLNPVKVLEPGSGLRVVDLRMRVRPVPQRWLPSRKDIPAAQMRGR
jgi:acyl-CoA synthetase (NDP forming)